jgi:steroid delta-isomerase-like uncharacterized protein
VDIPIAQIVQTYVEAFTPSGLDAWINTFALEGTYTDPGLPSPTRAHGLKEHFTGFFTAFPNVKFELIALQAISESEFVWRWIMHATHLGSYRGLPATGKTITMPGCETIEIRDDKVQRVQGYYDRLTMMSQMGLAPAPPVRA